MSAKIKLMVAAEVTPRQLAEAFSEMNDEEQAQFFIEAASIFASWRGPGIVPGMQTHYIGRHLKTCECSTQEARDFVRDIADAAQ